MFGIFLFEILKGRTDFRDLKISYGDGIKNLKFAGQLDLYLSRYVSKKARTCKFQKLQQC